MGEDRIVMTSRVQNYTPKMLEYKSSELQSRRDSTIHKIHKVLHSIDEMMEPNTESPEAIMQSVELDKLHCELIRIHEDVQNLLSPEDFKISEGKLERVERDICKHKVRFQSWIERDSEPAKGKPKTDIFNEGKPMRNNPPVEEKPPSNASKSPSICRRSTGKKSSGRSSSSNSSRASSLMMKEQARIAELEVEREFLLQKQQKDFELKMLEDKNNEMKVAMEIKKAKARFTIYQRMKDEERKLSQFDEIINEIPVDESYTKNYVKNVQPTTKESDNSPPVNYTRDNVKSVEMDTRQVDDTNQHRCVKSQQSKSQPVVELENEPVKEVKPVKVQIVEASSNDEMTNLVKLAKAPAVKINSFSGNPVDYPYFIATFSQAVDENVPDERGKLTRLIDCTTGEPHELMKSCAHLPDSECYQHAKELLKRKYGSPYRIANEFRRQLVSWPKLKANDTQAFDRFENYLIKYQASMKAIDKTSQCNLELIQLLQSKMPPYLQERWNRKVFQLRKQEKEAELGDFISFVSEETLVMSDPLFSRGAIAELSGRSQDSNKPKPTKVCRTSAGREAMHLL